MSQITLKKFRARLYRKGNYAEARVVLDLIQVEGRSSQQKNCEIGFYKYLVTESGNLVEISHEISRHFDRYKKHIDLELKYAMSNFYKKTEQAITAKRNEFDMNAWQFEELETIESPLFSEDLLRETFDHDYSWSNKYIIIT